MTVMAGLEPATHRARSAYAEASAEKEILLTRRSFSEDGLRANEA